MKDLVKLFIAGMAGVLFGGLILGFLIELIFTNWVESGSVKFGNWAMWTGAFFTLFAAIAAGIAATGALKTLSFMKDQHIQLSKENTKRFNHEKAIWSEQREMLLFQKQRDHKQEFYSILNNLEKEHAIVFFERSKFYSALFPENKFNYCDYSVELNENIAGSLGDIGHLFNSISLSLEDFSLFSGDKLSRHLEKHLRKVLEFSSILHVNFQDNDKVGDFYFNIEDLVNKPHILNIFDSLRTTVVMQEVFFELLGFTGNSLPKGINHQRTSFYQNALLAFFQHSYYRTAFIAKKKNVGTFLDSILVFCEAINGTEIYRRNVHLWSYYNSVQLFFFNPNSAQVSLKNNDKLIELLEKQKSAIVLFHKEKDGDSNPLQQFIPAIDAQLSSLKGAYSN